MRSSLLTQQHAFELFVGDLSFFCEEQDLFEIFSAFGAVEGVRIVRNDTRNRSLMFGFVSMVNRHEANMAVQSLNGQLIMGRYIKVELSEKRDESRRPAHAGIEVHLGFTSTFPRHNLIKPTETFLRGIFEKYGVLLDVVVRDYVVHQTLNKQDGYGFLTFANEESAIAAVRDSSCLIVNGIIINATLSRRHTGGRQSKVVSPRSLESSPLMQNSPFSSYSPVSPASLQQQQLQFAPSHNQMLRRPLGMSSRQQQMQQHQQHQHPLTLPTSGYMNRSLSQPHSLSHSLSQSHSHSLSGNSSSPSSLWSASPSPFDSRRSLAQQQQQQQQSMFHPSVFDTHLHANNHAHSLSSPHLFSDPFSVNSSPVNGHRSYSPRLEFPLSSANGSSSTFPFEQHPFLMGSRDFPAHAHRPMPGINQRVDRNRELQASEPVRAIPTGSTGRDMLNSLLEGSELNNIDDVSDFHLSVDDNNNNNNSIFSPESLRFL